MLLSCGDLFFFCHLFPFENAGITKFGNFPRDHIVLLLYTFFVSLFFHLTLFFFLFLSICTRGSFQHFASTFGSRKWRHRMHIVVLQSRLWDIYFQPLIVGSCECQWFVAAFALQRYYRWNNRKIFIVQRERDDIRIRRSCLPRFP